MVSDGTATAFGTPEPSPSRGQQVTSSLETGAEEVAFGFIFDRPSRSFVPVDVCFAPKADLQRGQGKTRPY